MNDNKNIRKRGIIISGTLFCLIAGFISVAFSNPVLAREVSSTPSSSKVPESFSKLVKDVSPSVVYISTVKIVKGENFPSPFGPDDPFRDFFKRYFGERMPRDFKQQSLGSGFIIDEDGLILTNNHVVEKTDEITVTLNDEAEYNAEIVGRDPKTDIALIRIKADKPLKSVPLGDSDRLQVGDWVVAIGNPFGFGHTVTAGIVSAKYRQIGAGAYENFIQTDASINRGNSGGPLLNTAGEVIGINTAIYSQSGGSIGIGFAIPINMVKDLLPQLKKGKVVRGWLGVMIQKITPELKEKLDLKDVKGALVADVSKDGPAESAGIQRGDVIVSFDGKEIKEMNELPIITASTPVGKKVIVEVIRKGKRKSFEVKMGELEPEGETRVASESQLDLGISVEEITPELARNLQLSEEKGLVVVQVQSGTPAEEAGIRQGDIILEVDQVQVKELEQFNQKIGRYKEGDTVLFLIKRQGSTIYVTLRIPK